MQWATTMTAKPIFRLALAQLSVGTNKSANLVNAVSHIKQAKQQLADIVVLPECFNSPYGTQHFEKYAEVIPDGKIIDADIMCDLSYTKKSCVGPVIKFCATLLENVEIEQNLHIISFLHYAYNTCSMTGHNGLGAEWNTPIFCYIITTVGRAKEYPHRNVRRYRTAKINTVSSVQIKVYQHGSVIYSLHF